MSPDNRLSSKSRSIETSEDNSHSVRSECLSQGKESILEAVCFAAEQFLERGDWESSVQAVLARLGQSMGVTRVYLVENIDIPEVEPLMNKRFEWVASSDVPTDWPGQGDVPYGPLTDWAKSLSAGLIVHGSTKDFSDRQQNMLAELGVLSLAIVPIFVNSRWWGFIAYEDHKADRPWLPSQLDALQTASSILGAAIHGDQASRKLALAHQQEITIGYEIQNRLLLGHMPQNLAGAQVSAISIPSQHINGDFYDFIQFDRQHFDLIIGDVMGKGVSAALLGAATKAQFIRAIGNLVCSTSLATLPTPEEVVAFAHEEMCEKLITIQSVVTTCLARFSLAKHRIDMVDCGHTGVICYHAEDGSCEQFKGNNLPLGINRDEQYEQLSIHFKPGDIMLFCSNGLFEIAGQSGESYGTERLFRFVENNANNDARALARDLYSDLMDFAGTGVFPGDLTYIVVKIEQPPEPKLVSHAQLELTSNLADLEILREFVQNNCKDAAGVNVEFLSKLEIATIEAASNIMRHAYSEQDEGKILAEVDIFEEEIEIRLFHWGREFGGKKMGTPAFDGSENGGFGLYFIRNCVDEVEYTDDKQGKMGIRLKKIING